MNRIGSHRRRRRGVAAVLVLVVLLAVDPSRWGNGRASCPPASTGAPPPAATAGLLAGRIGCREGRGPAGRLSEIRRRNLASRRRLARRADSGLVVIRVEPVGEGADRRRVLVEAKFPDDPFHGVVCRKEVVVE